MPAKLDRCVSDLISRKNFKPGAKEEDRKSSAFAICTASINRKHADVYETLMSLPENISFDIDGDGNIKLAEVENATFSDECDESEAIAAYDLHFNEKEEDGKTFYSFNEVELACKKKKASDDSCDDEENNGMMQVEMLREGIFKHPFFGDIDINRKMFVKMMENHLNDVLDREIAYDLEHEPVKGAVGWLRSMNIKRREFKGGKKRNVLIGNAKMTDEGEDLLKKKKFKYFSIEYHPNFIDKETQKEFGPTVLGGALTNRPFIPGMRPLAMSEDILGAVNGEPAGDSNQTATTGVKDVSGENSAPKKEEDEATKPSITNTDIKMVSAADKKPRPPDSELPNAAFALIKRDAKGNIVKRSLPHHGPSAKSPTENGSVDVGRLRNALARINQVQDFPSEEVAKAKRHLEAHAKALLKSHQTTASEQGEKTMDFQVKIDELQVKLDVLEDQNSELAKAYSEQIGWLLAAQKDAEVAKLSENDNVTRQLAERDSAIASLKEANERNARELAVITEEARRIKIMKYSDELAVSGHAPAVVKAVRDVLLGEMPTVKAVITFSEEKDGKTVEKKLDLRAAIEHIVNSIPSDKKVNMSESIKHDEVNAPNTEAKPGELKLGDKVVDLYDEKAIARRIKKGGYKTVEQ